MRVARPWQTIENHGASASDLLRSIVEGERITDIVLGLPRSLEGNDTPQTAVVRRFAAQLQQLERPITLQDEADTSNLAGQGRKSKAAVDAEAAAMILQDYLETL